MGGVVEREDGVGRDLEEKGLEDRCIGGDDPFEEGKHPLCGDGAVLQGIFDELLRFLLRAREYLRHSGSCCGRFDAAARVSRYRYRS